MRQGYLEKIYDARDAQEARTFYDDWSDSYDTELRKNGYVTPSRCAHALSSFAIDQTRPVLDFGCGTGLSGLALNLSGFKTIDGADLSSEMIAKARAKALYRNLYQLTPEASLPADLSQYEAITAIGAIGPGAAPISVFDDLMAEMKKGALLVLSLNDHALQDRSNEARINEWLDCAAARLLFRESGPHLPGIGLNSTVYVLEKN